METLIPPVVSEIFAGPSLVAYAKKQKAFHLLQDLARPQVVATAAQDISAIAFRKTNSTAFGTQ